MLAMGARGNGKTYSQKYRAIRLPKGEQFAWVRRYTKETNKVRKSFLTDLQANGDVPDGIVYDPKQGCIKDGSDVKGWFMTLSGSISDKSVSYRDVTLIVYDECILEKGRQVYLPNEQELLFGLYETINRNRELIENRPPCRLIMLGNTASWINPICGFFGIQPFRGIRWVKKGVMVAQSIDSKAFQAQKRNTALGRLLDGTDVQDYMFDNQAYDNITFVSTKGRKARPMYKIWYKGRPYTVWDDYQNDRIFISQRDTPGLRAWAGQTSDHGPDRYLVSSFPFVQGNLISAFETGRLWFDSAQSQLYIVECLQKNGLKK